MKRLWVLFTLLASALLTAFITAPKTSAGVQDFSFDSFSANYYLTRDTQKTPELRVDEVLVARFPDFDQNHGIQRAIPQRYQEHTLSLKISSVTDENGQPYKYTTSHQNDNEVLKIGEADKFVHGQKTYKISYGVLNVINYQADRDEFYWDINGDQWPQVFGTVTARIHIPNDFMDALQAKQVCYAGAYGSNFIKCDIGRTQKEDGIVITSAASALPPHQTQTVVLAFNKGTFAPGPEIAREQLIKKLKIAGAVTAAAIPPLLAFGQMFRRWRRFGDDPKGRGIIIPEYEPPKGFDVLGSDFLLSQELSSQAFSAMLVQQAVQGNLTIYEIPKKGLFGKKDFELRLDKTPTTVSPDILQGLKLVFGDSLPPGKRVSLNEFAKSQSLRRSLSEGMVEMEKGLSARLAQQGYFIKDPAKVKNGYLAWSALPFFSGIGLFWAGLAMSLLPLSGLGGGLMAAAVAMFVFAFIMPARTQTGVQIHDDLLGLKDYIKMAEADRLKYLQSPDGAEKIADPDAFSPKTPAAKVKLFEKLLPYAMLFGLEKDWAKQFKDLYAQPPDWYHGNVAAFNIGYLSGSLGDFSQSSGQVFSSPSSSSGSGFSGGAGGGGGGGGGGGW